jgi:hypothetical protein
MNANEHYVSQVLLRRFTVRGQLQSYKIQENKWRRKSPRRVFSEFGYNQLLVDGKVDNTLESAFSKVETHLPRTIKALEDAANHPSTELPPAIYENLCWYCAFLRRISPFAKMAAPADFVLQANTDLDKGHGRALREVLNAPHELISQLALLHAVGRRIIIDSENYLQLIYRIQFRLGYQNDYSMFRQNATWTICNSPVEFPVSDIALVQMPVDVHKSMFYVLPLGPTLLLKGQIKFGNQIPSSQTVVKGANLTSDEADLWLQIICLAAVNELVASRAC